MNRYLKILGLGILLSLPWIGAQAQQVKTGPYSSTGKGQYAVNINSVTTLTVPNGSVLAEICIETQAARYTDDGSTPNSSTGMPVAAGTCFQYAGPLLALQFIGQTSGATLDASYYK